MLGVARTPPPVWVLPPVAGPRGERPTSLGIRLKNSWRSFYIDAAARNRKTHPKPLRIGSLGTNWKFDPVAVIAWRLKDAVDEVTARFITEGGQMSREEADRRRAVANARVAEIELDERPKSVASVEDTATDIMSFCQVLKSGLDSAGQRSPAGALRSTRRP